MKKSYTPAQFDAFVISYKQQHGADEWPSADAVVRELGGGKSTARQLLDAARTAANRPIALSDGLLAALASEVRQAQDALCADIAEDLNEMRAATAAAEEAVEAANRQIADADRTIKELTLARQSVESDRDQLAKGLAGMTAERDALREDLDTVRSAAARTDALLTERTEEVARLRGQVDLLHSLIQRAPQAPAERTLETAAS